MNDENRLTRVEQEVADLRRELEALRAMLKPAGEAAPEPARAPPTGNKATLILRTPGADDAPRSYRTTRDGIPLDSLATFLGLDVAQHGRSWQLVTGDGVVLTEEALRTVFRDHGARIKLIARTVAG